MTKAELAARVEHLEQRIAALEQQDGRTLYVARAPTLAEIHVEILHRLRAAKEAGDLAGCRRFKGMLARIDGQ